MAANQALTSELTAPIITKLRIVKNLVLISLSFFLLFTAYDGLSMLQSTMNKKAGIGVVSQAVGYISFCVSAFLLPKYVIKRLGCKSSLLVSLGFYLPGIAANFYPIWLIMIPTSVLGGIGASILWGSQCTYFNESAVRYAKLITGGSAIYNSSPSNDANVKILSGSNSEKSEIMEEIPLRDGESGKDKLIVETAGDSVVSFKCKNQSCKNVEEFVVSEIAKNCVQFLKDTVDSTITPPSREEMESDQSKILPPAEIFSQTNEDETGIKKNDLQEEIKIIKAEDIVKNKEVDSAESASSKRNTDYQPIFKRATTLESVTGLFFGCHGIAFYSAQICSNIISYYVLKRGDAPGKIYYSACRCGANFCNSNPWCINDDTEYVSKDIRYLLTGICIVIASISVLLVFFFVDPLKKAKAEDEPEKISLRLISATYSHNKKKEQLCLIPISFFEGMQQGFYTADFTKSYVGCAWGASNVGLVSVFYGVSCVITSSTSGFLVKYCGRMPLFLLGQLLSISMVVFLLLFKPDSETPYKFYLGSTFFGALTGIYWSQLLAFYGLLFKKDEEAAFASYYLWSSLGWTTSFLYSNHLCTYTKIYILLVVSVIGTTGYLFAERLYGLRRQQGTVAPS